MKESEANETELNESEANKAELNESEANEAEASHDNVHGGGQVNDDVSSDDIKDEIFNYYSALEVAFDDEYDDELVQKDEMANITDYIHKDDQERNNKKGKEKWKENKEAIDNHEAEVLPNIRRKIEKTSTYTNLWLARMSDEHIFEVRHLENPTDKFAVNLKEHLCSFKRWELTGLPCVHALSTMKSRNH
ncbi:unnamed protein product [Lathyrus oleraceus]